MDTNYRKRKLRKKKILLLSISFPSLLLTATFFCNFVSMFLETPFDIMQFRSVVKDQNDIRESIYIPGAGCKYIDLSICCSLFVSPYCTILLLLLSSKVSGFFYTLGRLQAFHDDNYSNTSPSYNYDYHCFSAGCLALVTSLSQIPIDTVVKFAHTSRDRWISGDISRYDVVEYFVDKLINVEGEYDGNVLEIVENATIGTGTLECGAKCTTQENDTSTIQCLHSFNNKNYKQLQHALPRIHVITSAWDKQYGLSEHTQTPSSMEQLRRMLIQTTWM